MKTHRNERLAKKLSVYGNLTMILGIIIGLSFASNHVWPIIGVGICLIVCGIFLIEGSSKPHSFRWHLWGGITTPVALTIMMPVLVLIVQQAEIPSKFFWSSLVTIWLLWFIMSLLLHLTDRCFDWVEDKWFPSPRVHCPLCK